MRRFLVTRYRGLERPRIHTQASGQALQRLHTFRLEEPLRRAFVESAGVPGFTRTTPGPGT